MEFGSILAASMQTLKRSIFEQIGLSQCYTFYLPLQKDNMHTGVSAQTQLQYYAASDCQTNQEPFHIHVSHFEKYLIQENSISKNCF